MSRLIHERGCPWRIVWPDGTHSYHSYATKHQAEWASKRPDAEMEDKAARAMTEEQWLACMRRALALEQMGVV